MKKFKACLLPLFFLPLFSMAQAVIGLNVGNIAPDIIMKNPNDSTISLSSLRGKMVLIDFWASWCGPCRFENPNVVKTYVTYKDSAFKNGDSFTVYSVSLERENGKNAWLSAIKKDSLIWPYHVSDMKFWSNAAAQQYQVNSIPTNFLIDGNGVIVAKGLRGDALPKALNALKVTKKKPVTPAGNNGNEKPKKEKKRKKAKGTTDILHEERRNLVHFSC